MPFRIHNGTGTFPATGVQAEMPKAGPQHAAPAARMRVPDALESLQSPPANGADFSSLASVAAAKQVLDRRYLSLAGEPCLQRVAVPAALAEQHARYALDSTLAVINGIAAQLVTHSHSVCESGSAEQRAALELALKRFLARAKSTMTGLVTSTSAELQGPPSIDMLKLMAFASHGLWQGLDTLEQRLCNVFQTPVMTPEGSCLPGPAHREQVCAQMVAAQSNEFQRQMDDIQLTSVKRPGFDPAALVGVIAMRAELATVIAGNGASAAAAPPAFRTPVRAPPSSPASSESATSNAFEVLADDDFSDEQEDGDEIDADAPGHEAGHGMGRDQEDNAMDLDDQHHGKR